MGTTPADYGKYVVPAADHALAPRGYREPSALSDGARELLDEMRWELDWLLKMQREDGSVHHKVGPSRWTGNRAPPRTTASPIRLSGLVRSNGGFRGRAGHGRVGSTSAPIPPTPAASGKPPR